MRTPRRFRRFRRAEKKLTQEIRDLAPMMRESRSNPLRPAPPKDNGEPLGAKYAEFSELWEQQALEAHAELDRQLADGTTGTIVQVGYSPSITKLVYQVETAGIEPATSRPPGERAT